jgi:glutaredoxin 3
MSDIPNVSESGYTIYGATWCGACKKAKELCISNNKQYDYINLSEILDDPTEVFDKLKSKIGNYKTIPLIFSNGVFIGGYTELVQSFELTKTDDF